MNITPKLKSEYREFAKSIFLNMDKSNSNVRVIITLKDGYKVVQQKNNGKQVLVF